MSNGEESNAKDGDRNGWRVWLEKLEARQQQARAMGRPAKLEAMRERGELNARERITLLLDPDPVLVGAEDFSVMGGSIGLGAADKRFRLTQLAAQERVPLVFILHGAGHRMTNALDGHSRTPNDLQGLVDLSGVVPTVCIVLGPSAGHGALAAPLMDFAVMRKGAALFAAGPPLVEAAIGEKLDKEALGGHHIHVEQSGVVHDAAESDEEALALARRYLGHFPPNAWTPPPSRPDASADTGPRRLDDILDLVPADSRKPYRARKLLEMLLDAGSLLEVQKGFGGSIITAFGYLGGQSVALVANEPMVRAGALDSNAANKAARFIEIAGSFGLPVIFLADNPGVLAGSAAEKAGALRAAARMFAAQRRLQSPKLHVTLRKAFGFGSSAMAMNPFDRQTLSVAFPGATLAAMPARGGGVASGADAEEQGRLDAAEEAGSFGVANHLGFDEIIDPRDLRDVLLRGLELAGERLRAAAGPVSKIGVLP